jgi:segregation and condensation protein A
MQANDYKVDLADVFEGPMDLLVHLIKKNEVDIYDIPIALITDQYLLYIKWLKAMDIDFAGDFLVMAATLTQIKSRMLLPVHEGDEEEDDPRSEITKPLLEYLEMKAAAEHLANRNLLGEKTFVRTAAKKPYLDESGDELVRVGLFELIDAFQKILDKMAPDHRVDMTSERISVRERMTQIVDLLEEKGSAAFDELFDKIVEKSDIIVTFLAVLEMVKLNLVKVVQHVQTGIIRIFYL